RALGRKLPADQVGKSGPFPVVLAEQRVSIGHGLNAPIECLDIFVERSAAPARILGDHGYAREKIPYAMFQRRDERSLLVFRLLARSNVEREALEAHEAPDVVEFARSRFLEPYFPAIRMPEAKGGRIGRALGPDTAHHGLEVLAVVRMDAREKAARAKRLP